MMDEELSVRAIQEKMDGAFRAAMQRAINAGEESTPTVCFEKTWHSKSEGRVGLAGVAGNGDREPSPTMARAHPRRGYF
jgi:hypothetical protein